MSGIQLKLQQTLPAPGEQRARAAAADSRVEASEADWVAAANALRGEVRARFEDLTLLRRLEAVTADHLAELDRLIEAVDARYRVGAASQHDLLQLTLRRGRLSQTLADVPARAAEVQALLNGALARDPAIPITTPPESPLSLLPGSPSERSERLGDHPSVVQLEAQARVGRAEAAQARVEANPEPTLWVGYRVRAPSPNGDVGENFVTAGISVPLPFASTRRWRAQADAAEARARAADASAQGVQSRLWASLVAAETRYQRAAEQARAYRESLEPAARAALDSTLSAYQVDRAPFADLVRAELELIDTRRQALVAESAAALARAEILTLLGQGADGENE